MTTSYFSRRINELAREAAVHADNLGIPVVNNNPLGFNDARDAFRHAYISGLMAHEHGVGAAQLLGDLNEFLSPNPPNQYNMDQWNNQVGRAIGSSVSGQLFADPSDEIAQRVFDALQNGELIENLSDPRQFTGDDYLNENPATSIPFDPNGMWDVEGWNEFFKDAQAALPPASPIALDLDGDGIETISGNSGVFFDHDGNGFAEQTNWVSADDGILVFDRDGDGFISTGMELFGNETLLVTCRLSPDHRSLERRPSGVGC